jgi:hypothetical protein
VLIDRVRQETATAAHSRMTVGPKVTSARIERCVTAVPERRVVPSTVSRVGECGGDVADATGAARIHPRASTRTRGGAGSGSPDERRPWLGRPVEGAPKAVAWRQPRTCARPHRAVSRRQPPQRPDVPAAETGSRPKPPTMTSSPKGSRKAPPRAPRGYSSGMEVTKK